jgi:hypothetical protein
VSRVQELKKLTPQKEDSDSANSMIADVNELTKMNVVALGPILVQCFAI